MNKWQKILSDTEDCQHLSNNQRFWRTIALLRSKRFEEASHLYLEGTQSFRSEVRCQLLHAEILISQKQNRIADQLLCDIWPHLNEDKNLKASWEFCSNKLHQASEQLLKLKQRSESNHQQQYPDKAEDWQRFMKLPQAINDFDAYLHWLNWTLKQTGSQKKDLRDIAKIAMDQIQLNTNQIYHLCEVFKKNKDWEFLVDHFFEAISKQQNHPIHLWKQWHQFFPREWRPHLIKAMKKYTERYPDFDLEEFISQYAPRS